MPEINPISSNPHVVRQDFVIEHKWLSFPVAAGSTVRKVRLLVDGKAEREFTIELAESAPAWLAPLDVSKWLGHQITVAVDELPEDSKALELVAQSDEIPNAAELYSEPLRPQLHFSACRGWLNDPNGLVYYNGEYHLFFQHNPYGTGWGNMHWGHAVSTDLIHWRELGEALYPDELGTMFSGSAIVDWNNSIGLGSATEPPLILIYTAAGASMVQCIAYSLDGREFTKYAGNPVVLRELANRDPKVMWSDELDAWLMVVYMDRPEGHSVNFLTSPDLRKWTYATTVLGGADEDKYLYECPDFYELAVDGDYTNMKWVLSAADCEYAIGELTGATFTPDSKRLRGYQGKGYYAAQTYGDEPTGRRIEIGWLQADSPGMPFSQCMSLPHELTLRSTPEGPRLNYWPVSEIAALRTESFRPAIIPLAPGDPNPLAGVACELLEVEASFVPVPGSTVTFTVRGIRVSYESAAQQLSVGDHTAPAPLVDGRQKLAIYVDRTSIEVFASDGFVYVPMPTIPEATELGVAVDVTGGEAEFEHLAAHVLEAIWQ